MRRNSFLFLLVLVIVSANVASIGAAQPQAKRILEIEQWLDNATYSPTPGITDRDFWTAVGQSKNYQSTISDAEKLTHHAFERLPDDLFLDYSNTGNRTHYEAVFFAKLKSFRTLVVAECIENRGRFLPSIQQAVASYAADKTWVLPAHDGNLDNFRGRQITIDLFASEVACDLANADCLLGERLNPATRTLIRTEAERRIFKPYTAMVTEGKPAMWWLTGTNNWNAVCLANVTGTALALLDDKKTKAFYIASAEKYIASYFRGFTDDGYCSEGIGYWNYGYGCFVRLAHMIDGATSGHVDLFALLKARAAGLFARRVEITPGIYPAFADCTVGSAPRPAIMHYVTRRYKLTPTTHELHGYGPCRWLDEFGVFSFIFEKSPPEAPTAAPRSRDWFEQAGILICRGAQSPSGLAIGVALKGGNNAEHHNHNDVGSFLFCVGDAVPLVDPGAEVYTRRTFSGKRYDSNVLNSFGHPVPLVAGKLQRTGRAAAGEVLATEFTDTTDTIRFDLTSAYAVPTLKKLVRSFTFDRKSARLTVTDTVQFKSAETFGTALITTDSWKQIDDSHIRVGKGDKAVVVEIDAGGRSAKITPTTLTEDVRGGRTPVRLGIDLTQPVTTAQIRLTIHPR